MRSSTGHYLSLILFFFLAVIISGCLCCGIFWGTGSAGGKYNFPARKYLSTNEKLDVTYGAYGYLIFTHRPENKERKRYLKICEAFSRNLEPINSYPDNLAPNIMVTFWMVQKGYLYKDNYPDCELDIDYYDYSQAKIIAGSINKLSSKGPILVAWTKPFESVNRYDQALLLDMSNFSNKDIDRAFGIWMDQISLEPNIWNKGFNLIKAKESFRNFLEKYGDRVLTAIQTIKVINE